MKCRCPVCGASFSLDVLIAHDGARDAIYAAGQLPASMFPLILQYVGLFRPRKSVLSMDRVARLFSQLLEPIREHRVRFDGVDWPASDEMWMAALSSTINRARNHKLDLPLDNHNYLFKIIAGQADKEATKKEAELERDRKHGGFGRGNGPVSIGAAVNDLINKQPTREGRQRGLSALRDAVKNIGSSNDE